MRINYLKKVAVGIAMALFLSLGSGLAWGQEKLTRQASGLAEVSNAYLRLVVDNIPGNEPQGDFALLSTGGDPLTPGDNFRILSDRVDPYPQDMRTIVAVDWSPAGGGKFLHFGSRSDGTDIIIGETDTVGQKITSEWRDFGRLVDMKVTYTLRRDVLEMRYRLTNTGLQSHTYGLRVTLNVRPNATALASGADQLPEVPIFVPGSSPITQETKFEGGNVPDRWWCGMPTSAPVTYQGGFLNNFADARRPDELFIGNLKALQANPWLFEPGLGKNIQDAGVAVRWDPVRLSPNESLEWVTYYGYASASGDYSSPFVLAAVSPPRLELKVGDNPSTPATEAFYISPDPFEVRGYIYNISDTAQGNATLFLSLPDGLQFAPGNSPSKLIDSIPPHTEKNVAWSVHPTGRPAGTLTCLLSANVTPSAPRAVSRDVQVPPLASADLAVGVQMLSVPFVLNNQDPAVALGISPPAPLKLARWNTSTEKYDLYPSSGLSILERGKGYWTDVSGGGVLTLNGASVPGQQDVFLHLQQGWNQIGDPFELPFEWGRVKVVSQDQTLTLVDAVRQGLLRSTLFRWDPVMHEYVWSLDTSYRLQPWAGYWVWANLDSDLVFERVETTRGRQPLVQPEGRLAASRVSGGWAVEVLASDGEGVGKCVVGCSDTAKDGYDPLDVESPPPAYRSSITLRLPRPDWGQASGQYIQDIRSKRAGSVRWEMEVRTEAPFKDVTVSCPDLRGLPRDLSLYLEREDTGEKVALRFVKSVKLNTGAEGKAPLALIATQEASGGLFISTPQVEVSRGPTAFTFNLSTDAVVNIRILNLAGVDVRRLASGLALTAGSQSISWDGRSEGGSLASPGFYILQLEAEAADGQRFTSSRTFILP